MKSYAIKLIENKKALYLIQKFEKSPINIYMSEYKFKIYDNVIIHYPGDDLNELYINMFKIIKEYIGWEKNTTYTVIKRLIDKGAIEREDPGFLCHAIISKKEVQEIETQALLMKLFNGSLSCFFLEYLTNRNLSEEELVQLKRIVELK